MTMQEGISKLNVVAYFLMQFVSCLISNFSLTAFSYLLLSSHYNLPANKVGSEVGWLSFYSQFVCLIFDIGLGSLMDLYGRKKPILIGLFFSALAIIVAPFL
jgi:MFS family permease